MYKEERTEGMQCNAMYNVKKGRRVGVMRKESVDVKILVMC